MNRKKSKVEVVSFYHPKADQLITKRIPLIQKEVVTYAIDMARQGRPQLNDPQILFLPKIKSLFEVLLETVLKIIGAFAVLSRTDDDLVRSYEKEQKALKEKQAKLSEDIRVLQKELSELSDISHLIRRWKYKWRLVLLTLSIGEVAVNYKILLIVTPNQATALVASVGLCTVLFVIAHSFKDVLNYFSPKSIKLLVGMGIVIGVLLLLYNLNTIRISYMQNEGQLTSGVSQWSFVIINFAMWIAGVIIALIYKPLKTDIAKNIEYSKIKDQLKEIQNNIREIDDRLLEIPQELEKRLSQMKNLRFMAKHYENAIASEYKSAVSLFISKNLFQRKDGVSPKAFLEEPTKLKTYFDHILIKEST
ncbi:hypothetical protein [Pseudotenacibaculum haliotis]|uniref:Uncharacterized protein n=1 Tax=Pseudotenacibaculum haliotis TaxID=1862138 RepID=A0ABW5LMD8_9FLAO